MGFVPAEYYVEETKRLTGEEPTEYAMEALEDKIQERIQADLEKSA